MLQRRKIKVADPKDFLSWLRAAATAYVEENGAVIPGMATDRPCVNADHMLHALVTETVRLLLIVRKHSPSDFESEVQKVVHAIVTATGGVAVTFGGKSAADDDDDAEIDRRTLQ